jgi:chorismate-pyruvate lyase
MTERNFRWAILQDLASGNIPIGTILFQVPPPATGTVMSSEYDLWFASRALGHRLRFSEDDIVRALRMVVRDDHSIAEAARMTGCSSTTLRNWLLCVTVIRMQLAAGCYPDWGTGWLDATRNSRMIRQQSNQGLRL